ncbi:coproporphyrinogen dehydrogenase HemZ [Senegalia massiliensis]|uniref:coproporphyrinogen dehydrogenase HemZ n=1 Tax=Senegalia massiliensis TaxID=1720316 RepID=UPI00102FEB5E|nr:coproporphyrinogen dehydrogenase HemZ [Senegalia massiliensis]
MVNIYLKNYNKKHDIYELVKVLMETNNINFIDNMNLYIKDYLIIIIVKSNSVNVGIYLDKKLISKNKIKSIDKINIKKPFDKKINIAIKKCVYKAVMNIKDINTSWGILTGIRPSKIVHDLKEKNVDENEIFNILTEEYLIDIKKANLLLKIRDIQEKYVYPLNKEHYSLYISIPFCPSRCIYCSFPSYSIKKWKLLVDDYTNSLIEEIKQMAIFMKDKTLKTIYIGGGTPTSIPVENLEKIIKAVYEYFDTQNTIEFTVEAGRVDTINKKVLEMLKENRIDRISINPQTMNNKTLKLMNRHHTKADIEEIFKLAKSMKFNSINMDVIIGLPGENLNDIKNTMEIIKELDPDNLTVHTLTIKKSSKLNKDLDEYDIIKEGSLYDMLNETVAYSKEMNMKPYYMYRQKQILGNFENVGYAKKYKECIYNISMMEEKQTIIGLGAGAVSKVFYPSSNKIIRVPNVVNLNDYINRIDDMIERKVSAVNKMLTEEE